MRGQAVSATQTVLCRICIWPGCFVQVERRGWPTRQARAKSLLTGSVAQAAAGSCRNCPKRSADAAWRNKWEHSLALTRSKENRSAQRRPAGIGHAKIAPVAESSSQFRNVKSYEQSNYCITKPRSDNRASRRRKRPATPRRRHWRRSPTSDAGGFNAGADNSASGYPSPKAGRAPNGDARPWQGPQTAQRAQSFHQVGGSGLPTRRSI
jgi:hypothetical protein